MRVMGLDPGINDPGFSVFDGNRLIDYGVKRTWKGKRSSDQARLRQLLCDVGALYSEHQPDAVVIEDYQFRLSDVTQRNKNHLKKMVWAIGICIVGIPTTCEVVLVCPREWKGSKTKKDTIAEVRIIYGIEGKLNDNAADAIMIAHHYIQGRSAEYYPRNTSGSAKVRELINQLKKEG